MINNEDTVRKANEDFDLYIKQMPLSQAVFKFYNHSVVGLLMYFVDLFIIILKAPCLLAMPGELSRHWERFSLDNYFRVTFLKMAFNELCLKVGYMLTSRVLWR